MIAFQNVVVFDQFVAGTTPVYTSPDTYALLASADKLFVQLRASQTAGTSQTAKVELETCNDASVSDWSLDGTAVIAATSIPSNAVTDLYGKFDGATPNGALVRLKVTLAGGTVSGAIRIIVSGQVE